MSEHHCIIDELMLHSFSSKTFKQKLKIIEDGRPKPEMSNLTSRCKSGKREEFTRRFSIAYYFTHTWLTGCDGQNKLYCWPCILFSCDKNVWTKNGFSDLNHFSTAVQRHEKSQIHLEACLKHKLFSRQRLNTLIDSQHKDNIIKHNELVKKNREILKRLIDTVCFLTKQELPLRPPTDNEISKRNKGNYLEFLDTLKEYDPLLANHLKETTTFNGTSSTVQDNIVHAMRDVIIEEVKQDIKSANFVSILLDEMSAVRNKSRVSIVLRFVKDGEMHERFVGFKDMSSNRTPAGVFIHLKDIIDEFSLEEKLISHTYDGAVVNISHLLELKNKVSSTYPKAVFTPYHAHAVHSVLQQSLSGIMECNRFFQALIAFSDFFSESLQRRKALDGFVANGLASNIYSKWNLTPSLITAIKNHRIELIAFFEKIVAEPFKWDVDSCIKARGFIPFLSELSSIFLLEVFSKLFFFTVKLSNALDKKTQDIVNCHQKVISIIEKLQEERKSGFDKFWSLTEPCINDVFIKTEHDSEGVYNLSDKNSYQELFYEILDNILNQLNLRYGDFEKLSFCELLSCNRFSFYKGNFPLDIFEPLKLIYGSVFDFVKLRSELSVIYSCEEFSNLIIPNLLAFLKNNELITTFGEVHKLAELILTIPSTNHLNEYSLPVIQRIQTHCKNTQSLEVMNCSSVLCIEKDNLLKLRDPSVRDFFYDNVIEKFLSTENQSDLIFRL